MRFSFIMALATVAEFVARKLHSGAEAEVPLAVPVPEPGAPVFRLVHLCKAHPTPGGARRTVLRGITADIGPGLTCVVGPSGHGKSTLLNVLGGLAAPDGGAVLLNGAPLPADEDGLRRLRATAIGWVFQAHNLIGHLSAEGNVAVPLLVRGVPRRAALSAARRELARFDLLHRAGAKPHELSGGEAQRVAVARALVAEPEVVLADEPTGSLDPDAAETVMRAFADAARAGTPVVLVTHDLDLARRYATRVLRCERGGLTDEPRAVPRPAPEPVRPIHTVYYPS
jgi:ABC-type lipoprotein export system ATPase subunit